MHLMGAIHVVVIVSGEPGHEGLIRSVVKILRFLTHTVMALILKTALDATETRPFVT